MPRGDKPVTLLRNSQIKSYVNKSGYQISKQATDVLSRHLDMIMRLLMQIAEKTVDAKRLNDKHVIQMLENLYEGIPSDQIKKGSIRTNSRR